MNKNIMIILLLVAAVAVVVVAAVAFTGGDDNKDSDTDGPPLKDTLAVGDYYKTKNVVTAEGETQTINETVEIVAIVGDEYSVKVTADGTPPETKTVTRDEFLSEIYCDDVEKFVSEVLMKELKEQVGPMMTFDYNVKKTGTEVIDTQFGKVKCDVYDVKVTGKFVEPASGSMNVTIKLWSGCKNSVIYKADESIDLSVSVGGIPVLTMKMSVDITLTETNLFVKKA